VAPSNQHFNTFQQSALQHLSAISTSTPFSNQHFNTFLAPCPSQAVPMQETGLSTENIENSAHK
jgi:hypothetical protein